MSSLLSSFGEDFPVSNMSSLELPSPAWTVSEEEEEEDHGVAQNMAYVRRMEKLRAHYSGIHGALLLFQSGLAMVVVVFLSGIAFHQADKGATRDELSDRYVPYLPPF